MGKTILEEIAEENLAREIRLVEAIKPLLEPAVAEAYLTDAANLSLAISMKRIADEICGSPHKLGVTDSIYNAIEQGILNAARR